MDERDIKIGKHLKNARELRGFSIYEIAKFLKIDAYEYEKCELDQVRTKPGYVLRLSDFYDCSIAHLTEGKKIEPITSSALKEIKKELKRLLKDSEGAMSETEIHSEEFNNLDGYMEGLIKAYELIEDYE